MNDEGEAAEAHLRRYARALAGQDGRSPETTGRCRWTYDNGPPEPEPHDEEAPDFPADSPGESPFRPTTIGHAQPASMRDVEAAEPARGGKRGSCWWIVLVIIGIKLVIAVARIDSRDEREPPHFRPPPVTTRPPPWTGNSTPSRENLEKYMRGREIPGGKEILDRILGKQRAEELRRTLTAYCVRPDADPEIVKTLEILLDDPRGMEPQKRAEYESDLRRMVAAAIEDRRASLRPVPRILTLAKEYLRLRSLPPLEPEDIRRLLPKDGR